MNRDENVRIVRECGFSVDDAALWYAKYLNHKYHANQRGLKSLLTFKNYIVKAIEAGLATPEQIGVKGNQYQLGRIGDEGNYTVDNCRFITSLQNIQEAFLNNRHVESFKQKADARRGQTKETCEAVAKQAAKVAKPFIVRDPEGNVHEGSNLVDFGKIHCVCPISLRAVCRGARKQHLGWTGKYVEKNHHGEVKGG